MDPGESEALVLAVEMGVGIVLIDEANGRRYARRMGLIPLGMLGLLINAKSKRMIPAVRPLILRLRDELRFRLSNELINEALRDADEANG